MAKTINRSLVGGLTFAGMVILAAAGFLLIANLPGRDPKVYEEEAKKHEEKKEWSQAWQSYVRACQRDPEHKPDYLIRGAKCAIEEGNIPMTRQLITEARQKDPQLKSAADLMTSFEFELGKLFPSSMQWNRVLGEAKRLAAIDKNSALALQAMGQSYLSLQSEDATYLEKGTEALKHALELDPTNAEVVETMAGVQLNLAMEKRRAGNVSESEEIVKSIGSTLAGAIEKCPPTKTAEISRLKRLQITTRLVKGETDKAISDLIALAATEKESDETYLALGSVYSGFSLGIEKRDLGKAEEAFKKALEIDPTDGRAYQGLSQVYKIQRDGEKDSAKKQAKLDQEYALYRKGLELVPRTKHFREAKNNAARVTFFTELFLLDMDKANAPGATEDKKKEALASAESWANQVKKEIDPSALESRFLTASLLNARGDIIAATKEAEAAGRIHGAEQSLRLQALLAELYFKQNQWGAASKALQKAIALAPGSPILHIRLGQVYLQMNDATLALSELKPNEPGPLRDYILKDEFATQLRIEAYRQLGQPEQAKAEMTNMPTVGGVRDELYEVRLLMTEQRYNEAETKLKPILAKNPGDENLVRTMFRIYEATDRMSEAKGLVNDALAKQPDNALFRRYHLIILETEKNDDATLAFLKEEKDPFVREMSIADFMARKEKLKEALEHLDAAEKLKPQDIEMVDRQIRIASATKDWDRMAKFVARDGQINADGTEGKIAQGRMAYAQGKYQDAADLISAGLSKFGSNANGWTYLAETYMAMNNRAADAKNAASKALDQDPTNGYANRVMAQILLNDGDEKGAHKNILAASRSLPGDKWIRRQMQIIKEKENPSTGITAREKIRRDTPSDLENLVFLARLYSDSKIAKYDKAAEVFREALKVSNNDLRLVREVARFYGREEVNRPAEGDALLVDLMNKENDKARKAQLAACLGQFYEVQKALATADRYFRLAVSIDPSNEVLNAAGEFYARTNRFRDSVDYYNRLKKQAVKPEDATLVQTTHSRIIALWLAIGDLEMAKKEIDEFVTKYPTDPQGMIYTGAYHRIGGDIQKAKEAFDTHLEKDPTNATALWQRGQMYMLMGKWQQAVDDLRKAKTFNPDGFLYQHRIGLADALLESGRGDEAIVELRSILDQKPDQTAVAEALIDAYSRVRPARYADAENTIFTYMRLYPKDFKWPMLLGRLGANMQKWDKAVQGYEKAAELARDNRDVIAALFNAYKQAGKAKAMTDYLAEKISERQLERMPMQLAGLGWAYAQIGQKDRALEVYDHALNAAGEDFMIYTGVINDMIGVVGLKEAVARAMSRAQADPKNIEKQKVVVHLLQIEGKPAEALEAAKKVGELAVRDQDVTFAHLAQGMLLEQSGKSQEAKGHYEAVLKADPKQPYALNNIAYLLAETMNSPAEALPYAQQAVRADPNNADVLDTLGYILFLNNRNGEAMGALLRAKEIEHKNAAVLYHLGMVYMKKDDPDGRKLLMEAKEIASKKGDKHLLPKILKALGDKESPK